MSANLENSAAATGQEKVSFHSNPKEGQCKEYSNYCTVVLISQASKVILKSLPARLQQFVNWELLDIQAGFRKGRGTRDQTANILWIMEGIPEKQGNSRKISTSASLTRLKPLTVWITTNWKIPNEMGIPDYLTCLLRNLYVDQEAKVRTGHGTTSWFKMEKVVYQGWILSLCLFNVYAEYIMWNAQAGQSTSWNQNCQEKHQQLQMCRWYHSDDRK